MTPLGVLKQAVPEFERRSCRYCLIGGHAASLYRSKERLTRDVDFAVVAIPQEKSQEVAEEIISAIGLKPIVGFIPKSPKDKLSGAVSLVTSAPEGGELTGVIDILLPNLPWLVEAVERAQSNRINFGFASAPVITPEDLVVAKCYALNNTPDRFQDLDDLKDLFGSVEHLDIDYIKIKLETLNLKIPDLLRAATPQALRKLCR